MAAARSFASIRPDPNAGVSLDEDGEVAPPKKISEQEVDTYKEQDVSSLVVLALLCCFMLITNLAALLAHRQRREDHEEVSADDDKGLQGRQGVCTGMHERVH